MQVASAAAALGAAAGAAAGVAVDRALTEPSGAGDARTLRPNTGTWHTVAAAVDLPEGAVRQFDVGSVIGFVTRTSGQLLAVSGFCSHLHCRLSLDSAKRELLCPCHRTAFTVGGEVVRFQLAVPPPSLPHIVVREVDGDIQVLAP
ncbi:Rieske (2Fe-2S) protein [Phytohabitans flavus]|uniref:Rieske (2Fe-2S) protein n=1 Tax=Phytohabitans flavus TaxID=1076124 RepID=UPI0018D93172|nr:Rieske 2Fe-2S domain-containing protein [Phytohabitans flavus]